MEKRKTYTVTIELSIEEITVSATSKTEARKKALAKLNRKQASAYIRRGWPDNRLEISVDED